MGIMPQQLPPSNYRHLKQYWAAMVGPAGVHNARIIEQAVIYIAWNI